MHDCRPNIETLAKVNEAIQRIADKTGSKIVKGQTAVEFFEDNADCIFGGVIDGFCSYKVCGAEIHANPEDGELDELVKLRIELAIMNIIDLLEDELDLLRK